MTPDTPADGEALAFSFDRYVNGVLMAEGVTIERQPDLPSAMRAAARLASRGPNGETPVLVYRPAEPRRCAECDCEGGEMECNWMSRPAEPAQAAQVDATDDATAFERADWFWRTMDPDDCGDSPEEAINRAMVGRFCVCEIASSYKGPTRYGFIAPVADPESDDEEFIHFATHPEAIDEARSRARIAAAQEGRE